MGHFAMVINDLSNSPPHKRKYRIHFDESIRILGSWSGAAKTKMAKKWRGRGGAAANKHNQCACSANGETFYSRLSPALSLSLCIGTENSILFFTHVHREIYACRMILRLFFYLNNTWLLLLSLLMPSESLCRICVMHKSGFELPICLPQLTISILSHSPTPFFPSFRLLIFIFICFYRFI